MDALGYRSLLLQGAAFSGCGAGSGHRSLPLQGLGYRTLLFQGAVGLGGMAGSGCRSLLSLRAAGAGCLAMSRHAAGSGRRSLPVWARPEWDARLVWSAGPSGLGCSCAGAQILPGSGRSRFGVRVPPG